MKKRKRKNIDLDDFIKEKFKTKKQKAALRKECKKAEKKEINKLVQKRRKVRVDIEYWENEEDMANCNVSTLEKEEEVLTIKIVKLRGNIKCRKTKAK